MSLINDALRRARKAHQEAPPAPSAEPHFRPVEPLAPPAGHGLGLLVPVSLALVALVGLLLFWELSHRDSSVTGTDPKAQLSAAARTPPASEPPAAAVQTPAQAADSVPVNKTSTLSEAPAPAVSSASTNTVSAASDQGETSHPTVAEPAPPALKLQSIVYNPRRPSAMINGRVIFLGDKVREYRVMAIRRDEVMLVGAGQTNVLSLEP